MKVKELLEFLKDKDPEAFIAIRDYNDDVEAKNVTGAIVAAKWWCNFNIDTFFASQDESEETETLEDVVLISIKA